MKKNINGVYREPAFIRKVPCQKCGWYNDPTKVKKVKGQYRCNKCGVALKMEKDVFIDKLMFLMKGGNQ